MDNSSGKQNSKRVKKNIIIGSGPAGRLAALELGTLGKEAILIEKNYIGGNCLNEGCMVLCALSDIATFINNKKRYEDLGLINGERFEVFYSEIVAKIKKTQEIIRKIHMNENQDCGNTIIKGEAEIFEETVVVNGETLEYDNLLIATGSKPFIPNIKGKEHALSSSDILKLDKLPEKLNIIGGGAIATEVSSLFSSFGCDINMIIRGEFLKQIDTDLRDFILKKLLPNVEIHQNQNIVEIEKNKVICEEMKFDGTSFLATGRSPNSEIAKDLVKTDNRGAIIVDKMMKTNIGNVYAAGDVTSGVNLTPVARMEGIVAGRNMAGYSNFIDYNMIPQGFSLDLNVDFIQDKENKSSNEKEMIIPTPAGPGNFWRVLTKDTGLSKIRFNPTTKEIHWAGAISPSSVSDVAYISYLMRTEHSMEKFAEEFIEIHPSTDAFHKVISKIYKY
ncbi:MAG: NAD(P)/FAD-dependent oxidoreductase [Methanobrevibacter sp.]|jgi:dihydrolipoamide dehydrogenase|nr:NAD(P)/FAD-dependent oxidoreductase [Candidatus Methanovirga australis]